MGLSTSTSLDERLRRGRRGERARWRPAWAKLGDLVVITGFSDARKSTAMAVFEDVGYFCVDNLPPEMTRALVELLQHPGSNVEWAAIVSEVRGGADFDELRPFLDELRTRRLKYVVFLEADDHTALERYRETRRRHPLAPSRTVTDGIANEGALLEPVCHCSDLIDAQELLPAGRPGKLAVTSASFWLKHESLPDAAIVFDIRFLPNPPELKVLANLLVLRHELGLRPLTGFDHEVVGFIDRGDALRELQERLVPLLDYLLSWYVRQGKAHLMVGIGCDGGRHRSVVVAEWLAQHCRTGQYPVDVAHTTSTGAPRRTRAARPRPLPSRS